MLPADFLKTILAPLFRLVCGPWRRDEAPAFRPRLEMLETRAAPVGLGLAEAPPPPAVPALVRSSDQGAVADVERRPLPVLTSRAFRDRLFGDEPGDAVRGGKDLEVLFAGPLSFPPLSHLDDPDVTALCSGKDDTALIFARTDAEGAVVTDALFMDGSGW